MALAEIVRKSIAQLENKDTDGAAAELAVTYAERIDEDLDRLEKVGPLLLTTLDALMLTPKSRAAVQKGVKDAAKRSNPLDELRDRRAAREHNAEAVDSASS